MRIVVLTHVEDETDALDPVVDQVGAALRAHRHEVAVLAARGDVRQLIDGLERLRPELVFNLCELFGDDVNGDVAVAGILDALRLRYTGCGPGELYLTADKALGKKLLAYEQVKYPRFAVFGRGADLETGGNLSMPLFVKPARMDASLGIEADGLVSDATALMKRVAWIHEEVGDDALAEEYIDGREFHVGVLGNRQPDVFPPVEVDFSKLPPGQPHILSTRAKWEEDTVEYRGTRALVARLPDELRARLQQVAQAAYRALRVRDYGRVDLRVTEAGDIYVLEVNASCYLEEKSEFAMGAAAAGLEHTDLVARIVALAQARYGK
jgi:D-alanine-D-alanine ligase